MQNWNFPPERRVFRGKGGERELLVRRVEEHETDLVMQLQSRVRASMPDPSMMAPEEEWEVRESIRMDVCLGIFDGGRMAAFSLMVANRESPERNKGMAYGLNAADCVCFDITFVDPDYRGMGMQACLLALREEIARQLGAKYGFVTVCPANEHSLRNILGSGFEIVERKPMYGGLDRYVMKKIF